MGRWNLVLAMSFVPVVLSAQAAPMMPPPPPQIVVFGSGEVRVVPDRASLDVSVQTQDVSVMKATSDNARRQRAVMDTLRAMGIPATSITTTDYSVFPQQQYDSDGRNPRIVGYMVTNTIHIELPKMEMAGMVIDASLTKGANVIGSLQFSSSKMDDARRVALADAVHRAQADATSMAAAAGGTLGELLELTSTESGPRPYAAPMMKAADAGTPIAGGTQVVSVSVSARWKFVQK